MTNQRQTGIGLCSDYSKLISELTLLKNVLC